jgi:NAD(P)-dependent dehydrogenase (short-subunit alcohol dehydrogenase family)
MLASGGGAIVNTATTGVVRVVPHMAAFTAFKHGIVGLTKAVAKDYAARNIRANVLCPGATATPMLLNWLASIGMTPEATGAAIPIGRMARPDEQAEAAVWLCSPRSSYVTGVVLPVDGGSVL